MTLTTLQLSETNQTVTYRAHGEGAPLVMIHGVGMQSAAWTPQIAYFAPHFHVLAIDMPGHGGSDLLPRGSQLPEYVAWSKSVIDALDLGAVNLVGHSMGALIAGGVAVTYPQVIQRVALLNGVFLRDAIAKSAVLARAADIHAGKVDLETPLTRWFADHQTQARAQVSAWLDAVDQDGYATAYAAFAGGDATYADGFSGIACPFLALTGEGDRNSTPAMTHAMADLVQNGHGIAIDNHRHMINLTAADQVNAHLHKWLREPIATEVRQ